MTKKITKTTTKTVETTTKKATKRKKSSVIYQSMKKELTIGPGTNDNKIVILFGEMELVLDKSPKGPHIFIHEHTNHKIKAVWYNMSYNKGILISGAKAAMQLKILKKRLPSWVLVASGFVLGWALPLIIMGLF